MEDNKPLISIITVSYNAVSTIEETILSVLNQTYPNIEYIVIDGGSTDGTVQVIGKYANQINYWISEPDKGIYDAMNKGIDVATGEWINFMNCGDRFYTNNVIENFSLMLYKGIFDIFYGNVMVAYEWGTIIRRPLELSEMTKQMPFCHQSCFVSTSIIKKNPFCLDYKICSDYNFFLKCYLEKNVFHYEPFVIALYDSINGLSFKNILESYKEMARISKQDQKLSWHIKFFHIRFIFILKQYLKRYTPSIILRLYHNQFTKIKKT